MAMPLPAGSGADENGCWCCGRLLPSSALVFLGRHPEVGVCWQCAHFLHQRARAREDADRGGPAVWLRDQLRAARALVIRRGWHRRPAIGAAFRWLGRRLP